LSEVRGLRADISGFASSSLRAQLLMGRLQLQEQRILTLGRKLAEVQSSLATSRKEVAEQQLRSQAWGNRLKTSDAAERQRLEAVNPNPKTQLHEIQVRARELEAEQIELINQINAEQDRWTDFNTRLDALERLLPTGGL
jgi:chromosome segregation ATPase